MNIKEKREKIKLGLTYCTDLQQHTFKRMYSSKELDENINEVVDAIKEKNINWALTQVENTLKKNGVEFPENTVIVNIYKLKRRINLD